ncbi:MAG: MFS transporter [Acidimicrobiales bacterium]
MALPLVALSMDINGIGTVLPSIRTGLDTSFARANWVVSASTLAFAVALLPAGRWSARRGRRRVFLVGVVLLGVSGVVCGVAPGIYVLVAARAVQGLAGALCFTTSLAVVDAAFTEERRPAAVGAFGAISGVGAAAGPLIGGAMVAWFSWRGFFIVNAVLCLASVPALLALVPADRPETGAPALPALRLVALSAGVVLAVVAIGSIATRGAGTVLAEVAAALVAFAVAWWSARRPGTSELLLPGVRRAPYLAPTVAVAFASTWAFGVTLVYSAVYLQEVAGYPPLESGALFALYCASFAGVGAGIGPLVRRLGLHASLVGAMALGTVGLVLLMALEAAAPLAVVVVVLIVAGAGQGLCFDCSTASALNGVPLRAAGESSALAQAARLVGFSVGVALSATIAADLGTAAHDLPDTVRAVFAVAAGVSLIGTVVTLFLRAPALSTIGA